MKVRTGKEFKENVPITLKPPPTKLNQPKKPNLMNHKLRFCSIYMKPNSLMKPMIKWVNPIKSIHKEKKQVGKKVWVTSWIQLGMKANFQIFLLGS